MDEQPQPQPTPPEPIELAPVDLARPVTQDQTETEESSFVRGYN
jgi:hypothetical protein